jgi:hypothetical protein
VRGRVVSPPGDQEGTSVVVIGGVYLFTCVDERGRRAAITVVPVTVEYEHEFLFAGPIVSLVSGGDFSSKTLRATSSMRSETPSSSSSSCP